MVTCKIIVPAFLSKHMSTNTTRNFRSNGIKHKNISN